MTSKSLFFKRIKQDLHQRVWFPVILFVVSFIALELSLVSELDHLSTKMNAIEQMQMYLVEFFTLVNPYFVVTGIAAVICAVNGFSYMHSARKLDTYHSMPIKRETLFWQQYVYGIIYYVIPMVIHVVICMGIGTMMGAFCVEALTNMVWFMMLQTLMYLLFYSVSVLAVCLTGNMIISVLGCCVLVAYSWILYMMKTGLYELFFDTYYYDSATKIWAFSPIHLIANLLSDAEYMNEEAFVYVKYMIHYVKMLVQAAVYTLVALWLYKKRSSEAAGKSMAFGFVEPIVKMMVVLPVAFVSAVIFNNIVVNDNHYIWFVFGGIFGFVLTCLVMEAIFRQNPREVFKHPKHLAVNGLVVAATFLIFRFDIFGYDYYIPNNVDSLAVSMSDLSFVNMYSENHTDWCLENMKLVPSEATDRLIEQAIEDTERLYESYRRTEESGNNEYYSSIYVKHQLKNGKEVYRCYVINLKNETIQQCLKEIFDTQEYKLGAYLILSEGWKKEYNTIDVTTAYAEDSFVLSKEKMTKLIQTYQRELKNLSFEEVWSESPIAELDFSNKSTSKEYSYHYYEYESGYKIYDSFTQTIALLEEYGCIMKTVLPVEQIISVSVEDWSVENADKNGEIDKVMHVEYTQQDVDKLTEILQNIESSSLLDGINYYHNRYAVEISITYMLNDKEYERHFVFKPGYSIPNWLREALDQSAVAVETYADSEIAVQTLED